MVAYLRLIISIAFTVVSMVFLLIVLSSSSEIDELSYTYTGFMLVVGGLLMWSRR